MQNPLRHYPSVASLYKGVLPDGALFLDFPVFRAAFGSGETAKTFTRGEHDSAVCVLNAIGAQRVRVDTLEFGTWSEKVQQPEIFLSLFGRNRPFSRLRTHVSTGHFPTGHFPRTPLRTVCVQFVHSLRTLCAQFVHSLRTPLPTLSGGRS